MGYCVARRISNVSGGKGNDGTGAYDGQGEPDDARSGQPNRFSFHIETNE